MDKIDVKSFLSEPEYDEYWILVVGDDEYLLNPEDSQRVKKAIENGFKGVVQLKDAYVNLTYLREFYLRERKPKAQPQPERLLEAGPVDSPAPKPKTDEEIREEEEFRKLTIERSKLVARGYAYDEITKIQNRKTLSPKQFEARKKELLKQGKQLQQNQK